METQTYTPPEAEKKQTPEEIMAEFNSTKVSTYTDEQLHKFRSAFHAFLDAWKSDFDKRTYRGANMVATAEMISWRTSQRVNLDTELLRRRDHEYKLLDERQKEINNKYIKQTAGWESNFLQTHTQDELMKARGNNQIPDFRTPEDFDVNIAIVKKQVEAGILPPSALDVAIGTKEAGGIINYFKKTDEKIVEESKKEQKVIENKPS